MITAGYSYLFYLSMSLGEKSQLKEWEGGVGKGKVQGEKVSTRFFSRAARKDAGQPGKKGEVGGVTGGRWWESSLCM